MMNDSTTNRAAAEAGGGGGRRPTATAATFEPLQDAAACVRVWNALYPGANLKVKRGKWCDLDRIFDTINEHRTKSGLTIPHDVRNKNTTCGTRTTVWR